MEGPQEIEEMTSEKRHDRMDDATARRRANRNDAAAWMTRPRGKAECRMMRPHERRDHVTCAICIICRIAGGNFGPHFDPVFGPEKYTRAREHAETRKNIHSA